MISSAQVLRARTNSSRAQTYAAAPHRYLAPAHAGIHPKLTIAAVGISFIALIVAILTHLGTYDVALTHSTAQVDVQTQATKTASQPATATINASKNLVRIDQSSVDQYRNQQEYDAWWESTCSAASMTEVINAYGHNYKITDILKIESGIGAITSQGLLYPEGIDQTANKFNFATQTLNNPTLDQVLTIAGGGKPVIVNFPPPTLGGHWDGGHFLIVLSGTTIDGIPYVHLADSSKLNMQYMKRDRFLYYWKGLAKVLTPKAVSTTITQSNTNQYAIAGKPTLSASFINQVLAAYNSPAQGKGQALYDLGVQYGIDPAFALAFFLHESTLGTAGEATTTFSLGNLRCISDRPCVDQDRGGYAQMQSWEDGFQHWYTLIKQGYIQGNINQTIGQNTCPCTTISQTIPVYAPAVDHNDEQAYIDSLKHSLDVWHSGQLRP